MHQQQLNSKHLNNNSPSVRVNVPIIPSAVAPFHSPSTNFRTCSQVNVTTPFSSAIKVPSARIASPCAIETYPRVPNLMRCLSIAISTVPVACLMPFAVRDSFTSSFRMSCQRWPCAFVLAFFLPLAEADGFFFFFFFFVCSVVASVVIGTAASGTGSPSVGFFSRRGGRGPVQGPPPGAVTLSALSFPSASVTISNSTTHPSTYRSLTKRMKQVLMRNEEFRKKHNTMKRRCVEGFQYVNTDSYVNGQYAPRTQEMNR